MLCSIWCCLFWNAVFTFWWSWFEVCWLCKKYETCIHVVFDWCYLLWSLLYLESSVTLRIDFVQVWSHIKKCWRHLQCYFEFQLMYVSGKRLRKISVNINHRLFTSNLCLSFMVCYCYQYGIFSLLNTTIDIALVIYTNLYFFQLHLVKFIMFTRSLLVNGELFSKSDIRAHCNIAHRHRYEDLVMQLLYCCRMFSTSCSWCWQPAALDTYVWWHNLRLSGCSSQCVR